MLVTKPQNNFEPVHAMLMQSFSAKVVMSAVDLKLFDRLDGLPRSASELADEIGGMVERLEPLLNLMVAADLVVKSEEGYQNTSRASEFLVSSAPRYQGSCMRLTMRFNAMVEDRITELVCGGEVSHTKTDWGIDESIEGSAQDAMGGALSHVLEFTAALPGFSKFRLMGDIGGNHGLYTMGVLERNKDMSGVIFDLPSVVEKSQAQCDKYGFGDRVTTQGVDFRKDHLPAGEFDLILTSHVLYIFKQDLVGTLRRIAEGLKPGGWFVSHHYSGYGKPGYEMSKTSLELLTRLCGYSSHFIEQEELVGILESLGFDNIRCQPVFENGLGLMVAAQKGA
ncbi:methyltransferase [uncultured Pseudodesulfovibrio sp.]|uniref:methyltransferase n=1 Tax=uncultured Pseudodesulfovibrio sp. TaxID=2035858 RepID=UPI0029C68CF1|nr:methyltransferase [uncultured Pseudodesulfovibrio sp.]